MKNLIITIALSLLILQAYSQTIPPVPGNVTASTGPLTSVRLTFTDNSDLETGYEIQHTDNVDLGNYQHYTISGGTLGSVITTDITGYPHNFTIYAQVRAFRTEGGMTTYSEYSPWVSAETEGLPIPPSDFTATPEGNSLRLNWTDNSDNEAAFILTRFENQLNPNITHPFTVPANTTTFVDGIPHNVRFTYYLSSIDEYENVKPEYYYFQDPLRTLQTYGLIKEAPATPTELTATPNDPYSFTLNFQDHSIIEDGYEIHSSSSSAQGPFNLDWYTGVPASIGAEAIPLEERNPNTTYYIKIRAYSLIRNTTDTVYSEFSNIVVASTPSDAPAAPVAKLATFVTPTSFIANWDAVENADHYELYVVRTSDSIPLPNFYGVAVYGTSLNVSGTKPWKRYAYYVKAISSGEASGRSNVIRVTEIKRLVFATACSDNPALYRQWKVYNPNKVPVMVTWNVYNTSQQGSMLAGIGESEFTTQTVPVSNTTTLRWLDDKLVVNSSTKASSPKRCSENNFNTARRDNGFNEETLTLQLQAFPNPTAGKFTIHIKSPIDGEVEIKILSLVGRPMTVTKTFANTTLEVDGTLFPQGMYIIQAHQQSRYKTLKLIKE